jgi:hypothetical protein
MHRRERWYYERDSNRIVRPFEWGLPFVTDHVNGDDPKEFFQRFTRQVMQKSEDFYSLPAITDYQLTDEHLTWTSAVNTSSPENNLARARFFPAKPRNGSRPRRAVVVLPQWNAQPNSHVEACRIFNFLGISSGRIILSAQTSAAQSSRFDKQYLTLALRYAGSRRTPATTALEFSVPALGHVSRFLPLLTSRQLMPGHSTMCPATSLMWLGMACRRNMCAPVLRITLRSKSCATLAIHAKGGGHGPTPDAVYRRAL